MFLHIRSVSDTIFSAEKNKKYQIWFDRRKMRYCHSIFTDRKQSSLRAPQVRTDCSGHEDTVREDAVLSWRNGDERKRGYVPGIDQEAERDACAV